MCNIGSSNDGRTSYRNAMGIRGQDFGKTKPPAAPATPEAPAATPEAPAATPIAAAPIIPMMAALITGTGPARRIR
jgi:hypothetical protein